MGDETLPERLECPKMIDGSSSSSSENIPSAARSLRRHHRIDSIPARSDSQVVKSIILNNVFVYALGDKYDIPGLRTLAKSKFDLHSSSSWHEDDILDVSGAVYKYTPVDPGLRDTMAQVCARYSDVLMKNSRFRAVLEEDGTMAFDVLSTISRLKINEEDRHQAITWVLQLEKSMHTQTRAWFEEQIRTINEQMARAKSDVTGLLDLSTNNLTCRGCNAEFNSCLERKRVPLRPDRTQVQLKCRVCGEICSSRSYRNRQPRSNTQF